nr:DUF4430 domain-containing protein [uncultured Blautia sp.]
MQKVQQEMKRILSVLLVFTLLVTGIPVSVSAAEQPAENSEVSMEEKNLQGAQEEEILGGTGQAEEIQEEIPEETTPEAATEEAAIETEAKSEDTMRTASGQEVPSVIEAGQVYTLEGDLVFAEGQWFERIAGTLDGNGYTITLADKPLANEVSGTIQNLGVTSAGEIPSEANVGSIAMTLSGTIQNCYSTAKVKQSSFSGEPGGLVGAAKGGIIKNSYFAGEVIAMLSGFYGGLVGVNESDETLLANSCYLSGSSGPVNMPMQQPQKDNIAEMSLDDLKAGNANALLNTNIPDTGFTWTSPTDGSNNGLPVLTEGGGETPEPEKPDKTALQNLVDACKGLHAEGYTQESWAKLEEALVNAEEILENDTATKEDINQALEALTAAKEQLKKEKVTEPVAPPQEESQIRHVKSLADLASLSNNGANQYFVLDNDITVTGSHFDMTEFQGVLDGQGHTVCFEKNSNWLFQHLGEDGVLQNLHFEGENSGAWEPSGPIGQNVKGVIVNCSSSIKGQYACGFGKRLQGGSIINSYSISEGQGGVLFNKYEAGTLVNTYWQEGTRNPASFPQEALINSSSKSEEEMKTKEFVQLLNNHKGTHGTAWGQSSAGYPYFGENQEYNPEKPDLPENKYPVIFTFYDGTEEIIENQMLRVSPNHVGNYNKAGNFKLQNVPEGSSISWNITEVRPEKSMILGADEGDLRIDAEGSAVVTATETKADSSSETVAWIKVTAKAEKLEAIKLFIDSEDVTGKRMTVQGSEEKQIEVRAKYEGSGEFVAVNSSRFQYIPSDESLIRNLNGASLFRFKKPGTASMKVSAKADESIKAEVEITSEYVPVTSVKPGLSGTQVLHGRNANDPDYYAFLPIYSGARIEPANASYADNVDVKSSNPSIAEYIGSMVNGYVAYQAGTVTYTASIEQTNPQTNQTETVSGTSEVTYVYNNPLTSVTADSAAIEMENFTEQPLSLEFQGEKSKEGWSVTYPELEWAYDREGIVKISRKETGYWKKDSQWEGTPDFGMFVTSDKYYVQAMKEGTVTVTGTPKDKTNAIEPVKLTITVAGGEAPQVDIDALVNKGMDGAKDHFHALYPEQNFEYDHNDWIVMGLLRAGDTIPEEKLESYYTSVVNKIKTWKNTQKPTDIERVVLTLSMLKKDITNIEGINLAEMIYNHPALDAGSNELAWALLALDANRTEIPADAKWSRKAIIEALLEFQNEENGGFGLMDNKSAGVDTTAMALQSLAPYKNVDTKVYQAVGKGLQYLERTMSETYEFGTSEATAQVLLTLVTLGIDPLDSAFGISWKNTITALMDNYYCETETGKGFCHDKANKKLMEMSSVQVFQAFTAYAQSKVGEKPYWDFTEGEHQVTAKEVEQMIANLPKIETLTLDDAAVIRHIKDLYDKLNDAEKKKVKNTVILTAALQKLEELEALGEIAGTVSITVMDGLKKQNPVLADSTSGAEVKGVMIQEQVPIYAQDSMMSIIERTCKQKGIEILIEDNGTYIASIGGLAEFDRGPGSGWKGTLDGVFPDKSFADCTVANKEVQDQSVLTVEYTENLGKDLEENADLESLGLIGGTLKQEFKRDIYEYTLKTERDKISFAPKTFNRYSIVSIKADGKVYEEGQEIPVKDKTVLELISKKDIRGEDTKVYTFTVEKPQPEPNPDQKPNQEPNQEPVEGLLNEKYGVMLTAKGLTADMELKVTPLEKDSEAVNRMRKEIPSSKSIFRLYDVRLMQNGKEIPLPSEAILGILVGKEYENKELAVLHCVEKSVEKLTGKVRDEVIWVKTGSLGGFGVVIDTPSDKDGNGDSNNNSGTGNSSNSGSGQKGTVAKTGDETPIGILFLFLAVSAGAVVIIYRRTGRVRT